MALAHKPPPARDRFGLVYGILMALGVGTLLPWNVMITEKEFFDVRLHVPPSFPAIAGNFMSLFGLTFNTFNLLGFCVVACIQSGRLSLRAQILNPMLIILLLLAATAVLALRLDLPGTAVAYCCLPTLAVLGFCMAVLQGGVLNLACLFPPIYIQGFVVGAGLSGVGTSVLSLVTQLRAQEGGDNGDDGGVGDLVALARRLADRTPADVAPAAFAYFAAAASVTALCAVAFMMLGRLEFSRARLAAHYAAVRRAHHTPDGPMTESLLGAPYDENVPEEGEPLPEVERYYWPAALIPYLHPATVAAEASMYWEASPADDVALLAGSDGDAADDDAGSGDEESRGTGGALAPPGLPRAWSGRSLASQASGAAPSASAPVAVPGGGRAGSGMLAASAPQAGGSAGSYDSAGLAAEGGPSSYRCGTALRFYRSSSASALRGMLEAAIAQQQQQLLWQEQQGLTAAFVASSSAQREWAQRRTSAGGPASAGGELVPGSGAGTAGAGRQAPRSRGGARGGAGKGKDAGGSGGGGGGGRAAAKPGAEERSAWPFMIYAASIVLCMGGSLAVWPGVTAFICGAQNPARVSPCAPRGQYGRWDGDLFVPVMFVLFALGDVTGRIASSWGPWGRRPPAAAALLAYSVLRLGVAGALLFTHVVTPSPWQLPVLLGTDAWTMGLIVALGLTQGHLLSTACMHAPAVLPPGKEATFGPVTGFCITAGCLGGSVASTLLVEAFTQHGSA